MPFQSMKNICSVLISPLHFNANCNICPLARQSELPCQSSNISSKKIFELIYINTWGPYKTLSHDGYKYFLTIVDDYSRATWTHLLKTKSSAFTVLKYFLVMVERQFNVKVKRIRSDNTLEFGGSNLSAEFFASQGIVHQTICVHTPQQNSVVERKHKNLVEVSRALLHQSKLPISYWGECVLTATYLINLYPSKVLKNRTPYEVLFGSPPNYSYLRSFGCQCYASTVAHN